MLFFYFYCLRHDQPHAGLQSGFTHYVPLYCAIDAQNLQMVDKTYSLELKFLKSCLYQL